MDPAELGKRLDELAKKGLVRRTVKGDIVRYRLNDIWFTVFGAGFLQGPTDDRAKAMAPLANQYYYHGFFDHQKDTHTKGLRTLPIGMTIEDTRQILPYEELAKVLDQHDFFAVSTCPCKHRKNIDTDFPDCTYPTEVCFHFGHFGHYIVENGLGREVTRQETEEILCQAAEAGLVHGLTNVQERPEVLCNCCPCCCIFLEAFLKLKHAEGMTPANYRVHTNRETCIGCGLCIKRCPMEALHLEDFPEAKGRITVAPAENKEGTKELKNKAGKVSVANTDICIGCGVCAYKCPTKSLVLQRCEVIEDPPKDQREYVERVSLEIAAAQAKQKKVSQS